MLTVVNANRQWRHRDNHRYHDRTWYYWLKSGHIHAFSLSRALSLSVCLSSTRAHACAQTPALFRDLLNFVFVIMKHIWFQGDCRVHVFWLRFYWWLLKTYAHNTYFMRNIEADSIIVIDLYPNKCHLVYVLVIDLWCRVRWGRDVSSRPFHPLLQKNLPLFSSLMLAAMEGGERDILSPQK